MGNETPKKIDKAAAQAHFDTVLRDHEQAFETFFLARFLGLEFEYLPDDAADADKDACRVSFAVTDMVRNPQGSLHGGAMDISMGHLVNKTQGPGATIEMKLQFMRPVMTGRVMCEGRFLKRGRSISFMESRLWNAQGKLATIATATWKMP